MDITEKLLAEKRASQGRHADSMKAVLDYFRIDYSNPTI